MWIEIQDMKEIDVDKIQDLKEIDVDRNIGFERDRCGQKYRI